MPNFGTNMMLRILLDAYFREHSIYVMIGCQMTEISIKDGPIVKKKVVRLRFLCLTIGQGRLFGT